MITFSIVRLKKTIYKIILNDTNIQIFPLIGSSKIYEYSGIQITLEKKEKSQYIPSDKLIIHRHSCDAKYWPKDLWQKLIDDLENRIKNDN